MKFAFFSYRKWACDILKALLEKGYDIDSFTTPDSEYPSSEIKSKIVDAKKVEELDLTEYKALLFYGWSWILTKEFVDKNICVCLHPSPLPKYRGGSPIQNQIINGEDESAVSLLKMTEGIDEGPIYYQKEFSLEGDLKDILDRITTVGVELSIMLLEDFKNNSVKQIPQDNTKATISKRRKPNMSELTPEMLRHMTARQVHDTIRALQDPYPNAYIVGKDGKKVFLTRSKLED